MWSASFVLCRWLKLLQSKFFRDNVKISASEIELWNIALLDATSKSTCTSRRWIVCRVQIAALLLRAQCVPSVNLKFMAFNELSLKSYNFAWQSWFQNYKSYVLDNQLVIIQKFISQSSFLAALSFEEIVCINFSYLPEVIGKAALSFFSLLFKTLAIKTWYVNCVLWWVNLQAISTKRVFRPKSKNVLV